MTLQAHNYLAGTQLPSHSNNLLQTIQRTILHMTTIIFELASSSALLCPALRLSISPVPCSYAACQSAISRTPLRLSVFWDRRHDASVTRMRMPKRNHRRFKVLAAVVQYFVRLWNDAALVRHCEVSRWESYVVSKGRNTITQWRGVWEEIKFSN
jgi:hypothetical protein